MLDSEITFRSKRMLFRPGFHAHLTISMRTRESYPGSHESISIPVADVIEKLFVFAPHLLPEIEELEIVQKDGKGSETKILPLKNMRGRPAETFGSGVSEIQQSKTGREELFYSDGFLLTPPQRLAQHPDDVSELDREPFHFALHSEFHEYSSSGNAVHKLVPSGSGLLDPAVAHLGVRNISQLLPVHLQKVRFGLEWYKKKFFGNFLGQVPAVQSRLYVEVSERHIWVMSEEEGLRNKADLPLAETSIFQALDHSLSELGLHGALSEEIRDSAQY